MVRDLGQRHFEKIEAAVQISYDISPAHRSKNGIRPSANASMFSPTANNPHLALRSPRMSDRRWHNLFVYADVCLTQLHLPLDQAFSAQSNSLACMTVLNRAHSDIRRIVRSYWAQSDYDRRPRELSRAV
jgi:hypothetical protein